MTVETTELKVDVAGASPVSAILMNPARPRACYVLAHGAGAGMRHPFMAHIAAGLADRQIACLRYNFPYMEQGLRRPDSPAIAKAAVRAAVGAAAQHCPGIGLIAGGKSFGGRMTSQAQAETPLPGVRGLAFLGFPLHPDKKPSVTRAAHLADVHIPMLFIQGTRDGSPTSDISSQSSRNSARGPGFTRLPGAIIPLGS